MRNRVDTPVQLSLQGMPALVFSSERVNSVHEMTSEDVERLRKTRPKKLGIVCSRTECEKNLHCFRPINRDFENGPGPCRACGADLINWDEMWIRELRDAPNKFEMLKVEWIRHFFFHIPITPRIADYACQKGLNGLAAIAEHQLTHGKMLKFDPEWDFNQTKMLDGNIVHWARHAVACCCRKCMAYWHNVPPSASLSDQDVAYFKELIMLYISYRLPELQDARERRKPISKSIRGQRKAS